MPGELKNISCNELCSTLGLDHSAAQVWESGWAQSAASFPGNCDALLSPAAIEAAAQKLRMPGDIRDALRTGLPTFDRQPLLKRLFWHCRRCLFATENPNTDAISKGAALQENLGAGAPLFYAYVFLSGVEDLLAKNRKRGIADEISIDTLNDVEVWIRQHRDTHGTWALRTVGWLTGHFTGTLFRLGRLQFKQEKFYYDFHVFRHRQTREVAVFADKGQRFRADGQFANADGKEDVSAWVAEYSRDERKIRGTRIDPSGRAVQKLYEIEAREWDTVLEKGDPLLGVHIPAIGPLTPAACRESFQAATAFFAKHFPAQPLRGFQCSSWLLDSQFETVLPENSGIKSFVREFYLFPLPHANHGQTYERVFGFKFAGRKREEIEDVPQNSSLQKLMASHVRNGGYWRSGGGLIFAEDLARTENRYPRGNS